MRSGERGSLCRHPLTTVTSIAGLASAGDRESTKRKSGISGARTRHGACLLDGKVNRDRIKGRFSMNRIKTATVALLFASLTGMLPPPVQAQSNNRGDRLEDRWNRRDDRRDRRENRWDRREARRDSWDAARYYKHDARRYRARRLGRNDRIYRGSDNRYYCRRDDGTAGLIVGGISGGVLGGIIAPGGSRTLGAIIGAGAGAIVGKAIDHGNIVCR